MNIWLHLLNNQNFLLCWTKKQANTQNHSAMVACLQGQHLSVCPAMVSSAQITECCTSKLSRLSLSLSISLYVCLFFPPVLSLADRSEVADQAGRLSVWCNSLPGRQAASCDLLGKLCAAARNFALHSSGSLHHPALCQERTLLAELRAMTTCRLPGCMCPHVQYGQSKS